MTATANGNGNAIDANTLLEASAKEAAKEEKARKQREALEAKRAKDAAQNQASTWEELDYAAVDSINQAMLIMIGERIARTEGVKGLCATGRVELQVNAKRWILGEMTTETLKLDTATMAFLFEKGFSSEQILEIAADAKKAWCLGDKVTRTKDKEAREKAKKQAKIDRQNAILGKLNTDK